MLKFGAGLVLGILLVPLFMYLDFRFGRPPVAATDPPLPLEKMMAQTALHARLDREMPRSAPFKADAGVFLEGARVYRENCAACHGLIGEPEPAAARGMFPRPPQLLDPKEMVTDDPPGETFWKAKNGIRLSGMPGFHASLSDEQLWAVSFLLAYADKLPEEVKKEVTHVRAAAPSGKALRLKTPGK
jgi:thiosulfate dehydrogenase